MEYDLSLSFLNHDQVDRERWLSFVDRHVYGTVFHTPGMFAILAGTPHIEPYAFFIVDSQDRICAMLMGFVQTIMPGLAAFLTRRSVMLQSPLYTSDSALTILLNGYIQTIGPKAVFTEIRNHFINAEGKSIFEKSGFVFNDHLNFVVDCTVPDTTWKSISESKRRQIKKAQRIGVRIVDDPSEDQWETFYKILRKTYSEKVKKPLAPREYFQALINLDNCDYHAKHLLVEFNGQIIGGMIALISGNKTIHEHYIAGLDTEFKDQYPSVMATWAAIDYACRKGIAAFDFMGAGRPDVDYGVREFKARFGGKLIDPGRFFMPHSRLKYFLAEKGFSLHRKMKAFR